MRASWRSSESGASERSTAGVMPSVPVAVSFRWRKASGVGGREQYREDGEDQSRLLRASRATMRNLRFMLKVVESQQGELPDSSGLV